MTAVTRKAYKGMGMEGGIARWYDKTTRKDMPAFQALADTIAHDFPNAHDVLEIAPGPGFLSLELAKRGFNVRGIDISKSFVEIATRNAAAEGVRAKFELGNASALHLPDESVDFIVCRAAFKNFSEPVKALTEMRRVLRPGGTALLIDMRREVPDDELRNYVNNYRTGWVNRKFMLFTFRHMLIKRAYPLEDIYQMILEAGWSTPRITIGELGFEAQMTK